MTISRPLHYCLPIFRLRFLLATFLFLGSIVSVLGKQATTPDGGWKLSDFTSSKLVANERILDWDNILSDTEWKAIDQRIQEFEKVQSVLIEGEPIPVQLGVALITKVWKRYE